MWMWRNDSSEFLLVFWILRYLSNHQRTRYSFDLHTHSSLNHAFFSRSDCLFWFSFLLVPRPITHGMRTNFSFVYSMLFNRATIIEQNAQKPNIHAIIITISMPQYIFSTYFAGSRMQNTKSNLLPWNKFHK